MVDALEFLIVIAATTVGAYGFWIDDSGIMLYVAGGLVSWFVLRSVMHLEIEGRANGPWLPPPDSSGTFLDHFDDGGTFFDGFGDFDL